MKMNSSAEARLTKGYKIPNIHSKLSKSVAGDVEEYEPTNLVAKFLDEQAHLQGIEPEECTEDSFGWHF